MAPYQVPQPDPSPGDTSNPFDTQMKTLAAVLILAATATAAAALPIEARLTVTQDAAGPRIEPTV
jgi:hypothetical protein